MRTTRADPCLSNRSCRALAVSFLVAVSCTVPALELGGRECPCVAGYTCDRTSNLCLPNGAKPENCAAEAGPTLEPIGDAGACIDRTEVSVGDYRAFLIAREGDTSGQRADCASNMSFVPSSGLPPSADDKLPMNYVDFCDAVAYCAWAGKRLCGSLVDENPVPADALTNPQVSQWFRACSRNNDGLHAFPYGPTFDETRCNAYSVDAGPRSLRAVGSTPTCEGGYRDIFDMSGNVDEWEDSCAVVDGGVLCVIRGGNFNNGFSAASACATIKRVDSTVGAATLGFRCCSR
ncbi:MAG: hypothetical protein NVS3B10_27220 [Polyangiales bacterium]